MGRECWPLRVSPSAAWRGHTLRALQLSSLFFDLASFFLHRRTRPPPQGTGYTHNTHLQKEFEDANPTASDILNPGDLESAELALPSVIEVTGSSYKVALIHSGERICLYAFY